MKIKKIDLHRLATRSCDPISYLLITWLENTNTISCVYNWVQMRCLYQKISNKKFLFQKSDKFWVIHLYFNFKMVSIDTASKQTRCAFIRVINERVRKKKFDRINLFCSWSPNERIFGNNFYLFRLWTLFILSKIQQLKRPNMIIDDVTLHKKYAIGHQILDLASPLESYVKWRAEEIAKYTHWILHSLWEVSFSSFIFLSSTKLFVAAEQKI